MRKPPNTYVIIAVLIVLCAALTWILPGGQYIAAEDGTLTYEQADAVLQTWQIFSAVYHGFVKQAGIIVFILVVGGVFWLLNATGAVDAGIRRHVEHVSEIEQSTNEASPFADCGAVNPPRPSAAGRAGRR